jgi:hypothetical protein
LIYQLKRYPQLGQAVVQLAIDSSYYRTSKSHSESASLVETLVSMLPSLQTFNSQLYPASLRSIGKLAIPSMRELHVRIMQDGSDTANLCRELEAMDINTLVSSGRSSKQGGGKLRVFSITAYGPVRLDKLKYWE